ncbi:hypothetical protein [Nocardia stercoris]|uniref:Uncharacterized protein n=1 Tax=Nocardia stercoris TaxID=2483361 RepID=A0A3M2L3I6_9NOCA|nr:hypothetical protein [Nocardia stercoris]RMI30425.1 hypothetical protein EBN03_22060 [Nocardia stercoris]
MTITTPHRVPETDRAVPPLSGYLVAETDTAISLRVGEGTWTFDRSDVLDVTDGEHTDPARRTGGREVSVRIRPGAMADYTRRLRVELTERPMTLAPQPSVTPGDDALRGLTETWLRRMRLDTRPGVPGATMTFLQTRSYAHSDDGAACDSLD